MRNLSKADLVKASDVIGSLYEASSIDDFATRICERLPLLVGTDFVSYNELDTQRERAVVLMKPDSEVLEKGKAAFEQTLTTHPYMKGFLELGDTRAKRIDDVASYRQFVETPVYQEFYKFLSVRDQLITFISSADGLDIGIALTRCDSAFKPRDRDLLEFLRPQLFSAYKTVRRNDTLDQQRRAFERVLANGETALLMLDERGVVTYLSRWAEELLRTWFPPQPIKITRLPEQLSGLLASPGASRLSRFGKQLMISRFHQEKQLCVSLEETSNGLEEFGLSPREVEVLEWLAEGKRNNEIGKILKISSGTVKRHVDHILEKMAVETRTAAAAVLHRLNRRR